MEYHLNNIKNQLTVQSDCEGGGKYWKNGDWYLGKHLHGLGVNPVDTRWVTSECLTTCG
jgi:hypothetical protein